jgi:ADP-ribosylglycohydrolase
MINLGDSDTIGTIASAWYGALYGFKNVPSNLIVKDEELYEQSETLGKLMYEKYNEKTIAEF